MMFGDAIRQRTYPLAGSGYLLESGGADLSR